MIRLREWFINQLILNVTDSRVISFPTALTDQKGIIIELKA
jgi:hypothetical protein